MVDDYESIIIKIIGEEEMEKFGMVFYFVVGCGLCNEFMMLVIEYKGNLDFEVKFIVLVGKGLIFDLGGILFKLGEGMDEMKYDMCGVVLVFGIMKVIVKFGLLFNVIGVLVGCENMFGSNVYCLGDILMMMLG